MKLLDAIRNHLPGLRRVDLVKGTMFEFKKGSTYVIAFDKMFIDQEECQALSKILANKGVTNVTCIIGRADPTRSIAVLEKEA